MEFELGPLGPADLEEVVELEIACFPTPWSRRLFEAELAQQGLCYWSKALPLDGSGLRVAGYMGFWRALDEAHITNLAVRAAYRRQGLARRLVRHAITQARELGCVRATLEVRPSNQAAIQLYESEGFSPAAMRPGYYSDNGEDALIMWKNGL